MALRREQPEPYMYSAKRRRHHSYKLWKKQMNKYLRIKNKRIDNEDAPKGYGKKQWHGWEW